MNAPGTGTTPAAPWWTRPDRRIAALTAAVALCAVAGYLVVYPWLPVFGTAEVLPTVAFTVGFGLVEGFVVHLRMRRGGRAVGISEIPMVLGLLLLAPLPLLVARVAGSALGLTVLRGQRGLKALFNICLLALQAEIATAVFTAVTGGTRTGPRAWCGAYAAMFAVEIVSIVLVTAAISVAEDPGEWRRVPSALGGVPLVAVATTAALVGGLAVQRDIRAGVLLSAVSVIVYLGYRGYIRQSQGHSQVEAVYQFTRALDDSTDTDDLSRIVLNEVRDQLRANAAELIAPLGTGAGYTVISLSGVAALASYHLREVPADAWWAGALDGAAVLRVPGPDGHDGIAVPLVLGQSGAGVLLVADSLPDLPAFRDQHVRLFQALANHAGVSVAKSRLMDRLRTEAAEREHEASHDALTGLPNRRHFQAALADALRDGHPAAVMLMDLDRFKEVNDSLGHDIGDALLCEVGRRLCRQLAGRYLVARLGGDEFAVLVTRATADEATIIADGLARALEAPVHIDHLMLHTRASIGIALAPEHGDDAQTLVRRADVAMYAAKASRITTGRIYDPSDDRNTPQRLALLSDLRGAVQRRELTVVYQPKLDPSTGRVSGAEALVRWHHHRLGSISPEEFIPLAEHSGLIRPLTLHVLEVALRRCAAWRRLGYDLNVAVNLSPNSLLDHTLPETVARLLGQAGVPAAALTLEITEGTILADLTGSLATLNVLHALGVKLSIDDFGTGYSSLGRIRELPIHEVKIDKSFVQRIHLDRRDRAVVRSAVQLGHALDLQVVAEGVENIESYEHLAREGCNLIQGYLISRPLPPDEFTRWLFEHAAGHQRHRLAA
jgi:diguanylate cyclase (GGDEF)-like protein